MRRPHINAHQRAGTLLASALRASPSIRRWTGLDLSPLLTPLLLFISALAAAPADAAALRLGEGAWVAEGGSWQSTTAAVNFHHGFGFPVLEGERRVGLVFIGDADHALHGANADLVSSLDRELGVTVALSPSGDWVAPVGAAWGLGGVAVLPESWRAVGFSDGDGGAASLLVVDPHELALARRLAAAVVAERPSALDEAGYPLAAVLEAGPDPGWGFLEARSSIPVGGLAGRAGAAEDPWITTLLDDVALDGGRRVITVAMGARFVEKLTGT